MTVLCKHPDWQAKVSNGLVRPGGRFWQDKPLQNRKQRFIFGNGLRLQRECLRRRQCCTVGNFSQKKKGARLEVLYNRQWPEVYDLCHTFSFRVQFLHQSVFSDSRNVQKHVTKSDTAGHCLLYNPKSIFKLKLPIVQLSELCCFSLLCWIND